MLLHFCKTADCCLNGNFFVLSLQLFYVKNYFMFQNNLFLLPTLKLFNICFIIQQPFMLQSYHFLCRFHIYMSDIYFYTQLSFFVLFDCIIIILYVNAYTVIYCTRNVNVDLIKFYTQRYSCLNTSKDLMYIF